MASFNFNATAVEPMQARTYDPLPNGDYEVMITKSDVKPTKAGTGHYIELEMQILSGEHSGRRHWERLNIDNPNKTAEDIAKQALAALCLAVGIKEIEQDTTELHDVPFLVGLEIDRKDPTRNRIVSYAAMSAPAGKAASAPAAKPAAAAPGKKPWA